MSFSPVFSLDVVIPRILEYGMLESPREACGVIIPDLGAPADSWVHKMINRSETPEFAYSIDPATVRALVTDAKAWEDVLVWHTHPSGLVGPSKPDMEARIPGLRYLVVTLPRGEAVLF